MLVPSVYFLNAAGSVTTNVQRLLQGCALLHRDLYAEVHIDPEKFNATDQQTYEKWVRVNTACGTAVVRGRNSVALCYTAPILRIPSP